MPPDTLQLDEPSTAERGIDGHLRVLLRRKWAVLLPAALLPLLAVLVAFRQDPVYEASAQVLLGGDRLAGQLVGIDDLRAGQAAERVAETQARLARVPEVTTKTLTSVGRPADAAARAAFLHASSVAPERNTDLLIFTVRETDPAFTITLATAYARAFTEYRLELDTAAVERARGELRRRIAELEEAGSRQTDLYRSLVEREQQLATLEAFQESNAFLVHEAERAVQVQPRPVRSGLFGLVLGLVLGVAFALLWEALDTRVRRVDEISERLGLPLLARLPQTPRRVRGDARLVMLAAPNSAEAEAYRMLRTNIDFANIEREARTIMVTSAVQGEGKSTTIANLAVAFARAGRRVILVDLDLRRPSISTFFRLDGHPGITSVALGHAALSDALVTVAVADVHGRSQTAEANGRAGVGGALKVLPAGPVPPNPAEFVETRALASIVASLRDAADVVLIDAPPLLQVGDGLTLSSKVDALFVVARQSVLKRPLLSELKRTLGVLPAAKLGFCLTNVELRELHAYGSYYAPHEPSARRTGGVERGSTKVS